MHGWINCSSVAKESAGDLHNRAAEISIGGVSCWVAPYIGSAHLWGAC